MGNVLAEVNQPNNISMRSGTFFIFLLGFVAITGAFENMNGEYLTTPTPNAKGKVKKDKKGKSAKNSESKKKTATSFGTARVLSDAEVWGDFSYHQQSVRAARLAVNSIMAST